MNAHRWLYAAIAGGIITLVIAALSARSPHRTRQGDERLDGPVAAVRAGTLAFLRRELGWAALFITVLAAGVALSSSADRFEAGAAVVVGAIVVGVATQAAARVSTVANRRTAEAAHRGGLMGALSVALRAGSALGFTVAGLALVTVGLVGLVVVDAADIADPTRVVLAVALGASAVALFGLVGGGVYNSAADVGADLVGKVEARVPEDDPRNAAAIADMVGDNVGDVSGMAADVLQSTLLSLAAPMAVAAIMLAGRDFALQALVLPLVVSLAAVGGSLAGRLLVRPGGNNLGAALRRGTLSAAGFTLVASYFVVRSLFGSASGVDDERGFFLAILVGVILGLGVGQVAEIFTGDRWRPVKNLARQAEMGPATVVIAGLADGLRSAAVSVAVIAGGLVSAHWAGEMAFAGGGLYGIALAATGVLSTVAISVALDTIGPVADNAGGVAEMAGLPMEVRAATDDLDALGSTTSAMAKALAITVSCLTSFALIGVFVAVATVDRVALTSIHSVTGLLLGAVFAVAFAAAVTRAVGQAVGAMIKEVRSQFREVESGAGSTVDYSRCVAIASGAGVRAMLATGVIAVAMPIGIGLIDVEALAGFLVGAVLVGTVMAIFMINAGGAWERTKKLIEAGAYGGPGSDIHEATVIGDAIGDPFRGGAGPALNIVITLVVLVSLVFVPLFG